MTHLPKRQLTDRDKLHLVFKALSEMVRRFAFVCTLLLTVAFAMPAFESHACATEASGGVQMVETVGGADGQCPDCGPACANGCCHAPHSAMSSDLATPRFVAVFGKPQAWTDSVVGPLGRPDGPERPPRA
jgi:hypothetical protein